MALATDGRGHLLVADLDNGRVQGFSLDGTFLFALRDLGPFGTFLAPFGIGVRGETWVFIADTQASRVIRFAYLKPPRSS